jgi:eukaryotic-like serine/threonine-protein kinase
MPPLVGLATGHKLGPYEIGSPLGAGGMGEVYRARDTRLDRTVAIKVLPSHLSGNADLRARFEREARAISNLQHANICVLHDIGQQDGIDFLVMEFLEGETLSARLARKPLTVDEGLKIGIEIADALDKAHRSNIVHRDLKPGNVMLTKSGAKLMDFGLAKPYLSTSGSQSGTPAFSAAATLASMASPVTVAGTVVGTVQYMSPEQIQGKDADARSDIFAFGAMFYEMLAGRRAFEGKTQLSVASSILEKDPDPVSTWQPTVPPAIEYVVRTCLAKEPDERFQSAHDLKLQLQWIVAAGSKAGIPPVVAKKARTSLQTLMAALAVGWLLALGAGLLLLQYRTRLTNAQQMVHGKIDQPEGREFADIFIGAPAISPDGQFVAFLTTKKDEPTKISEQVIYLRRTSTGEATPLAGTQGATFPFWSPDGQFLGFFADSRMKKIQVNGGPAQTICDAPDGRGASWSSRGVIVFAPRISGPLQVVSDGGGTPTNITPEDKADSEFTARNPMFLPDGKHFLYTQRGGKQTVAKVFAGSLDGGAQTEILSAGSNPAFSDGQLFYLRDGTLTAQRFDPEKRRFDGKPVPIASTIDYYNPRDLGYFAVSHTLLVYRHASQPDRAIGWFDGAGKEVTRWGDPAPYAGGTYSPASQMSLWYRRDASGHGNSVWLGDIQRKTVTRLTTDSEMAQTGVVSADGNFAIISTSSGYNSVLVRRWLNATGKEEKLLDEPRGYLTVNSISRDGRYVFLAQQSTWTGFDIFYMDLHGESKLVPILTSPYDEYDARLSPDGKWLAYSSNETGNVELYVTSFPNAGAKWQVSNGGLLARDINTVMDWAPDGTLRYQFGDKIYQVQVRNNDGKPEFSAPKEFVTLPPGLTVISILADGKRILAAEPVGEQASVPLDFVLNWQHLTQ